MFILIRFIKSNLRYLATVGIHHKNVLSIFPFAFFGSLNTQSSSHPLTKPDPLFGTVCGNSFLLGTIRVHKIDFITAVPIGNKSNFFPSGDQAGEYPDCNF